MADIIVARGQAECPCLDTISWYDDSFDHIEPDVNELPYVTKVEEKRGRTGLHINLRELRSHEDDSPKSLELEFTNDCIAATPISNRDLSELLKQYAAFMRSQGHRVTLSGIGGDEPTGGAVPTPTPELQDLLTRAQFFTLARQLKAWALKMRKPRLPLVWEAIRGFFPLAFVGVPKNLSLVPWLHPGFVRRNRAALCGYPLRVKLFGSLPSFQDQIDKLDANRRFVAYCDLRSQPLREVRYPYYDRDFLEFMFAIPREQIVRVGQRRSLMKRALVGIVPDELLKRRRKAFAPQEPKRASPTKWPGLGETRRDFVSISAGIIDPNPFLEALQKGWSDGQVPIESLKRTLFLEFWLRHLTAQRVLTNSMSGKKRKYFRRPERSKESCLSACAARGNSLLATPGPKELSTPVQPKSSAS